MRAQSRYIIKVAIEITKEKNIREFFLPTFFFVIYVIMKNAGNSPKQIILIFKNEDSLWILSIDGKVKINPMQIIVISALRSPKHVVIKRYLEENS